MPKEGPKEPAVPDARAGKLPNRHTAVPVARLGALLMLAFCEPAVAQFLDKPRISVAPTIVAEPASQTALGIEVGPREALPRRSFVRLHGLPPTVALTEAHSIAPGSWAVALLALPALKAHIPTSISGRAEVVITLIAEDGTQLAEARTALVFEPSEVKQKALRFLTPTLPVPEGRPDRRAGTAEEGVKLSVEEKARAERLLARGEASLANGNVEIARQFFQRAADAGLAAAALRLGATYDPAELQLLQTQGVVADRVLARKWYERARELGAPGAIERLAKLGDS